MNSLNLFFVCLALAHGAFGGAASSELPVCEAEVTAFPPEHNSSCCGVTVEPPFKSFIGHKHPWSALLEYVKGEKRQTLCDGALISGRYVLTAANCVVEAATASGTIENVILGEYDTSHPGADCFTTEEGVKECTDGEIRVPVEKIISHPEYVVGSKDNKHDIALIRLAAAVPYTEFIRPICLPTEDVTQKSGLIHFHKASWGSSKDAPTKLSSVKQEVAAPFVPRDQCESEYSSYHITIGKAQFCSGDEKDFCRGDGGSALVYQDGKTNEVVGITSFGVCKGNPPAIYTNVYEYNTWIKSNIVD